LSKISNFNISVTDQIYDGRGYRVSLAICQNRNLL